MKGRISVIACILLALLVGCGDDSSSSSAPEVGTVLTDCGTPDGGAKIVLEVQATVTDADGDLSTVELVVGDISFPMSDAGGDIYQYSLEADSDARIECPPGLVVEVRATDSAGNVGSETSTIQ